MWLSTKLFARTWLKKSEKYTRTDMVYVTRGSFWLSIGQILSSASGFLLAIAFANLVPADVFGTYKYILSIAGIVGAFALSGIGTAITQAVSRGYEGSFKVGVQTYFKWSFLMLSLSIGGALYYFIQGNVMLAQAMLIVGLFLPIMSTFALYSSFLAGKKDFRRETILNIVRNLIPTLIFVGILFVTDNVLIILLAYFFLFTLFTGLCYYLTLKKHAPNAAIDDETVSYGKHLSIINFIARIAESVDKVLIFHFLGPVQLAIYAFAQSPVNQMKGFEKILARLSLPKFSERSFSEIQNNLRHKVYLTMGVSIVLIAIYILAAPYVYKIFFPQYIESVQYSQVFALTMLFFPSIFFVQALTAHKKKRELLITQTATPIFKIIAMLILLPLYKIWGAIIVLIGTQLFHLLLSLFLTQRNKAS